ncbi:MAG: hypothetical protein F4Z33_04340 [Gemmatimonadales bacterium]|nr:hypothetical protein [Gemmatimonadales bacterium]
MRKAIRVPSGDQRYLATDPSAFVSCRASPPAIGSAHTWLPASPSPSRPEVKLSHAPSGENCGDPADASPRVHCAAIVPSESVIQM